MVGGAGRRSSVTWWSPGGGGGPAGVDLGARRINKCMARGAGSRIVRAESEMRAGSGACRDGRPRASSRIFLWPLTRRAACRGALMIGRKGGGGAVHAQLFVSHLRETSLTVEDPVLSSSAFCASLLHKNISVKRKS